MPRLCKNCSRSGHLYRQKEVEQGLITVLSGWSAQPGSNAIAHPPDRAQAEQKRKNVVHFPLPEGGDQALHPQDIEHPPDIVG